MADRRAIAAAVAILIAAPAEGLRQWAYYDPPGILTVCYGSTGNVDKNHKYTIDECKARLNADMLKAVDQVEHCAPGLPVNVLAAFADAAYNMGPTVACDIHKSTAARLLQAHQLAAACQQLPKWDKASLAGVMVALPGLTSRRAAELELCMKDLP